MNQIHPGFQKMLAFFPDEYVIYAILKEWDIALIPLPEPECLTYLSNSPWCLYAVSFLNE